MTMTEMILKNGWSVMQDVHNLGEKLEIYASGWDPHSHLHGLSEWEPLERLEPLQLLFAPRPYFGRELRYFNAYPWWYRCSFETEEGHSPHAVLRFQGADYYAKVWLNGVLLGEHEGYFEPFEFEVGRLLESDGPNLLTVKVWAPWEKDIVPGLEHRRVWAVIRHMVKGTYEHGDTLVPRDVNPVGLWGNVTLSYYPGLRFARRPTIDVEYRRDENDALVKAVCTVESRRETSEASLEWDIREDNTGAMVKSQKSSIQLHPKENLEIPVETSIADPGLWTIWERGRPSVYRLTIRLLLNDEVVQEIELPFGVRTAELHRSAEEMTLMLNGEKTFLRGTIYFPEVYIPRISGERYLRDLDAIKRAGFNAIRVHVHVEKESFYDACDRLGLAVIQDSDLNWVHPTDAAWKSRALTVFGAMIRQLRHHPCIVAWACINEPRGGTGGELMTVAPGPDLVRLACELDPGRSLIKGSGITNDPESGDSHNYIGSLSGENTHYTEFQEVSERLNTEFGCDAPPCVESLLAVPELYRRFRPEVENIGRLQYYQYRFLKHFIEKYRIAKYRPCSGYFQFMFIDLCPQEFYGVYDYWGIPKIALKALMESNQSLGIFLEHTGGSGAVWVVNDLQRSFDGARAEWVLTDDRGKVLDRGSKTLGLPADSVVRAADLTLPKGARNYRSAVLSLLDDSGALIAQNRYADPFEHPSHPKGHPDRMSHELGMRLYDA